MEMHLFLGCLADKNKSLIFDSFSANMLVFHPLFLTTNKKDKTRSGMKYIYLITGADFLKYKKKSLQA